MRLTSYAARVGMLSCLIGAACTPQRPETTVLHLEQLPSSTAAPEDPPEDLAPEPHDPKVGRHLPGDDRDTDLSEDSSDDGRDRARDLFRRGADAYAQGDYLRARDLFQEAYDLVREQALLFNIASAELRMGDVVGACHHFRQYVSQGDPADPRVQQVQAQVAQRCKSVP